MIPLAEPNTGPRERALLNQCIDSNFVSSVGPFVDQFEQIVARRHGASHCVAVAAGTMALHAGLVALGVRPGDLVLLPSFTFIASANAISHAGAQPWLIDIDPDTWTLDPDQLAQALTKEARMENGEVFHRRSGKRVSAILPVYTLGVAADMDRINAVAKSWGLPVLADAAAAVGGGYRGRSLGGLAQLTAFSFNGNKTITTGGGGALVGNDEDLLRRVRHLTTTARRADIDFYHHDQVGFNYRMTNLAAAVGCAQMERLDEFNTIKRRIRRRYNDAFFDIKGLGVFPDQEGGESSCWLSGVVLGEAAQFDTQTVCNQLAELGIMARPFWKPVHLQPPYAHAPRKDMVVCENFWRRILTLPSSTTLSEADQDLVISGLFKVLGH